MRVDRMFFETLEDKVKEDAFIQEKVAAEEWESAIDHVIAEFMDKPAEYFTLDKLRKAAGVDRQLPLREILQKIFGMIPYFKSKDELLDEEFQKFVLDYKPSDPAHIVAMKYFFKAYISDASVREIIESKRLTDLNVNPSFTMHDFKSVPPVWRSKIPEYVKDYVSLNRFTH
jgi:type I restriction enzyme R subunit